VDFRYQVAGLSLGNDRRFTNLDHGMQNTINTLLQNQNAIDQLSVQLEEMRALQTEEFALNRTTIAAQRIYDRNQRVELFFLESLRFETMGDRFTAIEEAHKQTFQWVFNNPSAFNRPWSDFSEWLEAKSDMYWIQGKAGSGKSTLMRFLTSHTKTADLLKLWSPSGVSVMAKFFFWKGGVQDQRSAVGLFRSLLWEALSERTELIPHVFSQDWDRLCDLEKHSLQLTLDTWNLPRLQTAFRKLANQANENLRLCFFIDGVDELEGDQGEISCVLSFLKSFESLPFIKFIISSRPWPIFNYFLDYCPGLRLQDLTSDDIRLYIQGKLNENDMMIDVVRDSPTIANQLAHDIASKADGVFLWVRLVVKSLLNGLVNGDSIFQLQQRLAILPPDLEDLYAHMLKSVEKLYLEEASKVFQMYRVCIKRSKYLTMGMLHIALTYDVKDSIEETFRTIQFEDFTSIAFRGQQAKRLYTRSGGLLEFKTRTDFDFYGPQIPEGMIVVQYLHRTVADYIETPLVWDRLLGFTVDSNFEPYELLLRSLILELKNVQRDHDRGVKISARDEWDAVLPLIVHDEPVNSSKQVELVDELDKILTESAATNPRYNDVWEGISPMRHWSSYRFPSAWETDMLSMAIDQGLLVYIKGKLEQNPTLISQNREPPLLAFALKWVALKKRGKSAKMVKALLENGANPNELYLGHTLWEYTIHYVHVRLDGFAPVEWEDTKEEWFEIFKLMIKHGADLDACCLKDCRVWERIITNDSTKWNISDDDLYKFIQRANSHRTVFCGRLENGEGPLARGSSRHTLRSVIIDMFGSKTNAVDILNLLPRENGPLGLNLVGFLESWRHGA
jgi:hypothetical protein